jgi:hypothetical protein
MAPTLSPDGRHQLVNNQWVPVQAAPPPPPAASPAPQLSPDGKYQLVNNQWVPVQAAPPSAPAYPVGPPPPTAAPMPWQEGGASHYPGLSPGQVAELEGYANRPAGGFDDDPDFYAPKKGATVGATAESHIRIVAGWHADPDKFFHRVVRHFCFLDVKMQDGTAKRIELPRMCPGDQGQPCPICERRERATAAGDKELSKRLQAKERFFLNVFDGDNPQSHYAQGATVPRAKVWGISAAQFVKLTKLIGKRGKIWDRQQGKYLSIYATCTGPEKRDVKYDMLDMDGVAPLPPGFEGMELINLETLDQPKSYAELAAEIAGPYPDVPANMQMRPGPQAAAPPYNNPYAPPTAPPQQSWSPPPPVAAAPPPPMAVAPPPPPAAPQLSPDGRHQLVNNAWVPVQAAPPPPPPPQMAPPPPPMAVAPPPQLSPDGKYQLVNNQWVPVPGGADSGIPF